jgi:hypothetical protein
LVIEISVGLPVGAWHERDAKNGKLNQLAEKAIADRLAGRARERSL